MYTSFVNQLLATETPWVVTHPVDPCDKVWESSWATASNMGKKNLARGWLWCVKTMSTVGAVLTDKLEFIQEILPYLDHSFVETLTDESWCYGPALLGFEQKDIVQMLSADDLIEARLLNGLFFGNQELKETNLVILSKLPNNLFNGFYSAVAKQAWSIAANDKGDLRQAAITLSILAGGHGVVPSDSQPEHGKLAQILGYFQEHGKYADTVNYGVTHEELKQRINNVNPALAAELLLPTLTSQVYEWNGGQLIVDNSFLTHELETVNVYTIMKTWIPKRSDVFDHAESLELDIVHTCRLIAEEAVKNSTVVVDLPVEITKDAGSMG